MSPVSKRQQTMAKRNREHAVQEKRTLKREKKRAAAAARAAAKAAGESPVDYPIVESPAREPDGR
jgi:hypothetical protein